MGERICQYRVQRRLSQQEVAEKLEVSRQSVSKWETDGAVPELDKLVKLCELFEVTLDELVRGEKPQESEAPEPAESKEASPVREVQIVREKTPVRLIVGGVLLGVGLLASLIFFALGGAAGLYPLPIAVCGIICLLCRKNAGLICGWVLFGLTAWYLRWATGLLTLHPFSPRGILLYFSWGEYPYTAYAWIGLAEYIVFYALVIVTLYRLVKFVRGKIQR